MVHLLVNIFHENANKYILYISWSALEVYPLYLTFFVIISVASVMSSSPCSRFVIFMVNWPQVKESVDAV